MGSDGSVYIADKRNHRVRRILTDSTIITIAGNSPAGSTRGGFAGDGQLAISALLHEPQRVAVAGDGTVSIADRVNNRVRQVGSDGIITTIAGNGLDGFFTANVGDGSPATAAALSPIDLAIGADGVLYIADEAARIRAINNDGIIRTLAGSFNPNGDIKGDGGAATASKLARPLALAVGVDTIYLSSIADTVRQVKPFLPGFFASNFFVASEDASVIYFFDDFGKHLETRHALTGAVLYAFDYDSNGQLVEIRDGDGNKTTIKRDLNGDPTAIIAPFGQQTTLALDANNYLASITNPASEQYQMVYTSDGLLTEFKDPRNNSSIFTYDTVGRLHKDTNADGGFLQLSRVDSDTSYDVAVSTALNRVTNHHVEELPSGDQERIDTFPDGTKATTLVKTDGSRKISLTDGTVTELIDQPDPRFGMQSPLPKSVKISSDGLASTTTMIRTVTLSDSVNPLSLISVTDELNINGRVSRNEYRASTRTFTSTSPSGHLISGVIDTMGRTTQIQIDGLLPMIASYDRNGRVAAKSMGVGVDERLVSFDYNSAGFLSKRTDALGRATSFQYDLAGRTTRTILPDTREILYNYDANGNLTSITPPGGPAHVFRYTAVNLRDQYTPPDIGIGVTSTVYHYNLDQQLIRISRPDGQTLSLNYDLFSNSLIKQTSPLGDTMYGYDALTGKLSTIDTASGESLAYSYNDAFLIPDALVGHHCRAHGLQL